MLQTPVLYHQKNQCYLFYSVNCEPWGFKCGSKSKTSTSYFRSRTHFTNRFIHWTRSCLMAQQEYMLIEVRSERFTMFIFFNLRIHLKSSLACDVQHRMTFDMLHNMSGVTIMSRVCHRRLSKGCRIIWFLAWPTCTLTTAAITIIL